MDAGLDGGGKQEMSDIDWGEQGRSMLSAWLEAQKALWDSWAQMTWGAQGKPPSFADMAGQWQRLATQGLQNWGEAADPIARATAEQFVAAQGVALRFVEFAARAWEMAAPRMQSGQDWQTAVKEALDQLRERWVQFPAEAAGAAQDANELWRLYVAQWQSFGQPWEAVWRSAPGRVGRAAAGDNAALLELTEAARDAYQQTFGRLADSPNLGLTRELVAKVQAGFDAFVAWHLASAEYQAVLGEVWEAAFKCFGDDLASLAEKGGTVESVRELVLLWTRGAERVFTDAFRTERYTLAQGKLLNATMHYRLCQREIIEEYLKAYDLPTRSELDEAHRRIYQLRREVKALKKRVAEMAAAAGLPQGRQGG